MRALVTGVTGYVGSRLCGHLVERGWTVDAAVRPGADLDRAGGLAGVTRHDLRNPGADLGAILAAARPDAVIHLAAAAPDGNDAAATDRLVDANVRLAAHLADALGDHPGAVLVHAASWWEWDAGGRFAPSNPYAATKAAGRIVLEAAARSAPFAMASLVLHDVYGSADWRGKIVDMLLGAAVSGQELALSPGEQRIDLVHVDDVAAAFEAAAHRLTAGGGASAPAVHAVATGRPITVRALAAAVGEVAGRPVPARWGARPYAAGVPMMPGRMAPPLPDWTPAVGLADGLAGVLRERER
jgi:nucleoside-diphosphate-sugar epimerase